MSLKKNVKECLQDRINERNRERLLNKTPSIICSNCTGGFLYHWLGLEFRSPFINLYMTPGDFVTALEHFEEFMKTDFEEIQIRELDYPVGRGAYDTRVHFMHYKNFTEAQMAWNRRKARLDVRNMGIMLANLGGGVEQYGILERFEQLPFKHKVAFTDRAYPEMKSVFQLKGYDCRNGKNGNVYATQKLNGMRYIDQFDYVEWINHLAK